MTIATPGLDIAVLLYPGCVVAEVAELATRLSNEGATLWWASPDGSPIVDVSGLKLTPTSSLADLSVSKLDALIVPGGDPESVMGDPSVRTIVKRCAHQALVAGICAGVLVLADAGILHNRRATHNYRAPWAPPGVAEFAAQLFDGATIEDDPTVGVVVDGSIITALPNATAEFSIAVCNALGLYDDGRSALVVRHLQGEYVPALFDRAP